jgi:oligopeptide/dipeptide ABC transporter ATP-binding protein
VNRSANTDVLLTVERLEKRFPTQRGFRRAHGEVRALDGVSFEVTRGETFGLVGESGCGKSTLARCVLRLLEPSGGRVVFDGIDVGALPRNELRSLRRRMQIVFQDPFSSLDPRMTAFQIVEEPLTVHGIGSRGEREAAVTEMLELVGLTAEQANRRPHAFSGGQRQRIGIARALVLKPDLVVLDEPISALDVSIQAQVLNLLRDLQQRLGLTYVFIAHDLGVAEYFCDRLAVLYLGEVMELATADTLFRSPLHPYTASLLSAVPVPDYQAQRTRPRIMLRGEVDPLGERTSACPFRPRCPVGRDREICADAKPPLVERAPGQLVACHFPGETPVGIAPAARTSP